MYENNFVVVKCGCCFCGKRKSCPPPPAFGISAYAVNDYSHISNVKAKNLSRSIAHKNKFINKFTDAIGLKYPSVQTKVRHDREDASATSSNFISDNTDKSEFVFFAGHGQQQTLAFYDKSLKLSNGVKSFGGNTRWVLFDACLVLNVNKTDFISQEYDKKKTQDPYRVLDVFGWFNGVHVILGNYALGWQGTIKKHWYSSARWRTEDVYSYFSEKFIEDGEPIVDAYFASIKKVYNNFSTGITGYKVAAWYFYGVKKNGDVLDMSKEKFKSTYNAPVSFTETSTEFKTRTLMLRTMSIGKPRYE